MPATSSPNGSERIVFALDYPNIDAARVGLERVRDHVGVVKVGLELFTAHGPAAVELGRDKSGGENHCPVFLDLKLHDIPATVQRAVARAASLGVRYLTVHAAGGEPMLRAAVEAAGDALQIVAVTVLTSMDERDLRATGVDAAPQAQAMRLARLAYAAGVRTFVCSPVEVGQLKQALGSDARFITPGVRPAQAERGDQKRVCTPSQAIANGADLLVIGRPIRDAPDPVAAASAIAQEIGRALRVQ